VPTSTQTKSPAASPAVPALGRFGPLAVSVAALAVVSMGLIAWSHIGWSRLQARAHSFDTLLSETQFQAHEAQWLAEQRVLGQTAVDASMVGEPAERALAVARQLQAEAPEELAAPLQHLVDRLGQARQSLALRVQTPPGLNATQLRQALTEVDEAAR